MATDAMPLRARLDAHGGWVTCLATSPDLSHSGLLLSGSRDKSLIVWDVSSLSNPVPKRRLRGHSHFISDLVLSSDAQFALSSSWDCTMRLWDLNAGNTTRRFVSHTKDVLSVAFSADNRQIVSGGRDKVIKLWNTLGECKYTIEEGCHTEWVSCVRFSPTVSTPIIVSSGWDKLVKVWGLADCKLKCTLAGHTGYINTVTISPDSSLCASGGKDGTAMLWDLNEGKHLYSLDAGEIIHSLLFSPNRYWLCAATQSSIIIWDLEGKGTVVEINKTHPEFVNKTRAPMCLSLAWSADGNVLYSGWSDNIIRVWEVAQQSV